MSPSDPSAVRASLARYSVLVDENFHYMDESVRYQVGEYASYEEAIARCHRIIDEFLTANFKPGMTAEELFGVYNSFGEDPFVSPDIGKERFSASTYARARCAELCA